MSWYIKGSGREVYQCKTNTRGQLTDFVLNTIFEHFQNDIVRNAKKMCIECGKHPVNLLMGFALLEKKTSLFSHNQE